MSKQETPEMVERVARALARKTWKQQRSVDENRTADEYVDACWRLYAEDAATAIDALMEPTEAMLRAGDRPGWDDSVTVGLALEIWQAMLRAALSQGDDK